MNQLLNVNEFELAARELLAPMVYDYYRGGAEDELTVADNRAAWQRWRFVPRMLVDVSHRDLSTSVLGQPIRLPVITAPCGFNALAHADGELAVARAVTAAGTVQIVSTAATFSLEEIAQAAPAGLRWFQLYCYRNREITAQLVQRANAARYQAICLTVDAPLVGRRERDIRNGFGLPAGLRWKNLEGFGLDRMDTTAEGSALTRYIAEIWDTGVTWETVAWLRQQTALPLILKGILSADDARRAVDCGVAGLIVSNHGGRQLDGAIASGDALASVVDAIAGQAEVYVDGGIRRGSDVLKALALGARAVMIGRPYLWGLAVGGEAGVRRVLEMIAVELELAMALAGRPKLTDIDRSLLVR